MSSYKDFEKWLFGCDHGSPITTSDSAGLTVGTLAAGVTAPTVTRRIYVGVSGDVKIDEAGGETGIVYKAVPVGMLDVHATKVYATGTTATNLIAKW